MNRRMLLKAGGAAILVSGLGASGLWLNTRAPLQAIAPWQQPGKSLGDDRLNILAYAILAPSPHNRQPWQVHFTNTDTIELYCRLDRRLPHTDPFDRQILIGLGCFVEAFTIAAKQFGFVAQITAFPDGEPGQRLTSDRIATIKLTKTTPAKDPLFKQMLNRRSAKVDFDTQQPIKANVLSQLTSLASVSATVDDSMINALNNLSYEALAKEMSIPHTLKESVDLMRIGKEEINQSPDGIDMSGAPMELMNKLGMLTREGMYEPKSVMNTSALDMFKAKFNTSMGYVWLTSANNSRMAQLRAGREYYRLNLLVSQLGLGIQPLSQALQEYPEMATHYDTLHQLLEIKQPKRIQMLARIGYCAQVPPSPRWPVETIVMRS